MQTGVWLAPGDEAVIEAGEVRISGGVAFEAALDICLVAIYGP
ncbi:MAG TPA: hypothetical protein VF510_09845 [Ktedonobacterales bacterium]